MAASEAILAGFALVCGIELRFLGDATQIQRYFRWPDIIYQVLAFAIIVEICLFYNNLYDLRTVKTASRRVVFLGQSLGTASLLLGILYLAQPKLFIGRGVMFISIGLVCLFVLLLVRVIWKTER